MKKYEINYYFTGNGTVIIQAKSKKEAEEMFFEGNFTNEEEWGEDYFIENTYLIKKEQLKKLDKK